jgi:HEAT repeat protein
MWVTQKEYERLTEETLGEAARARARKDGKNPGKKKKRDLRGSIPKADLEDWEKNFAMPYIRDLGANSWRKQDAAINTLISQEFTHKLVPLILETVFDGNDKAREGALETLIRMKYPDLLPFLEDRLENDKAKNVRIKAIYGLGEAGDAHSVSILLKAIDPQDMEITREVLASLESITFVPSGGLFSKPDPTQIKNKYKSWLSKHAGKTRQQILEMVLDSGGPYEKIGAVKKMYAMGDFEKLEILIDLLRHEKEDVQSEANNALKKLTGVDQGFKASITFKPTKDMYIQNWVDWFEGERERRKNAPAEGEGDGKTAKKIIPTDSIFMEIGDGGDAKEKAKKKILEMKKSASIPLCIKGLNHSDFFIRNTIFNLLITITRGEVLFGYDPKEENEAIRLNFIGKWEKWWEENKHKYEE